MAPDHLILFTRYPRSGQAKTRLIPALGPDGAARLQRRLTESCLARLADGPPLTVFFHGGDHARMRAWLPHAALVRQQGSDLGQRMIQAMAHCRGQGAGRILLAGTDCPDLEPSHLNRALDLLSGHDLVFGPALDGGFYLIGIGPDLDPDRLTPLFAPVAWGTGQVLATVLKQAGTQGLTAGLLEPLPDIDTPQDLAYLADYPRP